MTAIPKRQRGLYFAAEMAEMACNWARVNLRELLIRTRKWAFSQRYLAPKNDREVRAMQPIVQAINSLERLKLKTKKRPAIIKTIKNAEKRKYQTENG